MSLIREPGSTVYVCLLVTNDLALTGYQASVEYDPNLSVDPTEIQGVRPTTCVTKLASLASFSVEEGTDCVALGIVVDFSEADCTYPPDVDQRVAVIPVTIPEEAQPGETLLVSLKDGCGVRELKNLLALRTEARGLEKWYPEPEDVEAAEIEVIGNAEDSDSCVVAFNRGLVNEDNLSDVSDAITIFGFLFIGDPASLNCDKAADVNDDGGLDLSDGISLLTFQFLAPGPDNLPPPAPFDACGLDPTQDNLTCLKFPQCE